MHARTLRAQLPAEHLDQALAGIRENAGRLPGIPGFRHGYWLYDREQGVMRVVVLFDDAATAEATWEQMGPAVLEGWRSMGITPELSSSEVVFEVEPAR